VFKKLLHYGVDDDKERPREMNLFMERERRPLILTFLCIFGFLYSLTFTFINFIGVTQPAAHWFHYCLFIGSILTFSAFVAIWNMKKWGVILITIVPLLNHVLWLIMAQKWFFNDLVVFAVIIFFGYKYYSEMDPVS